MGGGKAGQARRGWRLGRGAGTACLSKPWKWGAPKARGKPRGPRVPLPHLTAAAGRNCLAQGHPGGVAEAGPGFVSGL